MAAAACQGVVATAAAGCRLRAARCARCWPGASARGACSAWCGCRGRPSTRASTRGARAMRSTRAGRGARRLVVAPLALRRTRQAAGAAADAARRSIAASAWRRCGSTPPAPARWRRRCAIRYPGRSRGARPVRERWAGKSRAGRCVVTRGISGARAPVAQFAPDLQRAQHGRQRLASQRPQRAGRAALRSRRSRVATSGRRDKDGSRRHTRRCAARNVAVGREGQREHARQPCRIVEIQHVRLRRAIAEGHHRLALHHELRDHRRGVGDAARRPRAARRSAASVSTKQAFAPASAR